MAYCPACSAQIRSNVPKCPKCGADFSAADAWKPLSTPQPAEPKGSTADYWIFFLAADALFAAGATALVHAYDCRVGTHEQCLMSSGMILGYWLGFLIFPGSLVAATVMFIVRNALEKRRNTIE
jgi:hypothetical protein